MNKTTWTRALQLDAEMSRRGEEVTRTVIQDSLQVTQAEAQHIVWSLENKDIIKCNPDIFSADGERCIICADIHIPYQDNLAVSAMLEYMLEYDPTTIIIDGDLIDPFSFGKLWILHGHEKPGGAYNPEYITNVIWQYVHDHFCVGHFHRGQEKVFKNISGDTFWACSIPYLAGKMDYAPLNKWNQGFVRVDYSNNGNFRGRMLKIIDGEIY